MKLKTGYNQWKNTQEVINWFKSIKDKKRFKFIQFDICDFYASISEELLIESVEFDHEKEIIFQTKKSLLFDENTPWTKKGDSHFDVGMGSFDGAEICELVGLFLLSKLQNLNISLGLYRDDGLGVCSLTARQVEKLKQTMCKVFQKYNLKITTDVNHKIVNFLDVTLDLDSGIFKPYMKPNNTILYVNKNSNHSPQITKNIPAAVNKRLSNISADETVFRDAIPPYQQALNQSGYEFNLKFEPDVNNGAKKRNRGRKITWFNPHTLLMCPPILAQSSSESLIPAFHQHTSSTK